MLRIHESAKERFQAAKKEARRVGLIKQFVNVLMYLRQYAEDYTLDRENVLRPVTRVTLYYDFAPHSFSVVWERRQPDGSWKPWFQGGLIYHGPHDNGGDGGAPTFSVNLSSHHGWRIHT